MSDDDVEVIHENTRYEVVLGDVEAGEDNYLVINKEYGTIEASTENLPQALLYAEQFAVMLDNNMHEVVAKSMGFGGMDDMFEFRDLSDMNEKEH